MELAPLSRTSTTPATRGKRREEEQRGIGREFERERKKNLRERSAEERERKGKVGWEREKKGLGYSDIPSPFLFILPSKSSNPRSSKDQFNLLKTPKIPKPTRIINNLLLLFCK